MEIEFITNNHSTNWRGYDQGTEQALRCSIESFITIGGSVDPRNWSQGKYPENSVSNSPSWLDRSAYGRAIIPTSHCPSVWVDSLAGAGQVEQTKLTISDQFIIPTSTTPAAGIVIFTEVSEIFFSIAPLERPRKSYLYARSGTS